MGLLPPPGKPWKLTLLAGAFLAGLIGQAGTLLACSTDGFAQSRDAIICGLFDAGGCQKFVLTIRIHFL
jgi:hypothetical protein